MGVSLVEMDSSLEALRIGLLATVAVGYLAIVGLLIYRRAVLRHVLFASYCFALGVKGARFAAGMTAGYEIAEPLILVLCALAVLESFWGRARKLPRPRRRMVLYSGFGAALLFGGVAHLVEKDPHPIRRFEQYRATVHTGIAAFAVTTAFRLPISAHGVILTIHTLGYAVRHRIAWPAGETPAQRWRLYYVQAFTTLVWSLACIVAWLVNFRHG